METSNHAPKLENGLDLRGNGVEVMLEYRVTARRIDSHGSEAEAKAARLVLDTDMAGRDDAFNPAEMLLASLATCLLKGPSA